MGDSSLGHEEDAGAPGALQRLEHGTGRPSLDEGGDVARVTRDQRAGPDRLREVLEVGLVDRVGEAGGIVHDERARGHRELREEHAGGDCPRPFRHVVGGVVAHDQHVEVVDRDRFGFALVVLYACEKRRFLLAVLRERRAERAPPRCRRRGARSRPLP